MLQPGLDLSFSGSQAEYYNSMWRCPRPGLNPSGLVNNSSLAAGPQFTEMKIFCKLTANVQAHYDNDFVYMRVYYGRYLRLNEEKMSYTTTGYILVSEIRLL